MRLDAETGVWESAGVVFRPAEDTITIAGRRTVLDHRSTAILQALLENAGAPVRKDVLMARAWPDRVLQENSIAKAISKLRSSLDGSGYEILSVHGVGYKIKEARPPAEVEAAEPSPSRQPIADEAAAPQRRWRATGIVALLGALLAFVVWSYLDRAPAVPVRTSAPLTNDPPGSVGTVLWVDDHPENNALDVRFLRSRKVAVHLAKSTGDALQLLAINDYDLVISDLGRGDDRLAGTKLATEIRARGRKVPVMIYTIRPDDAARQKAQRELVAASGATDLALTPGEVRAKALAAMPGG